MSYNSSDGHNLPTSLHATEARPAHWIFTPLPTTKNYKFQHMGQKKEAYTPQPVIIEDIPTPNTLSLFQVLNRYADLRPPNAAPQLFLVPRPEVHPSGSWFFPRALPKSKIKTIAKDLCTAAGTTHCNNA